MAMKPKPKNPVIGSMKRMPSRTKRMPVAVAKKMGAEGPKKKTPVPTKIYKKIGNKIPDFKGAEGPKRSTKATKKK